ncbi:MAG: hypothetical protein L0H33_04875 [Staphylococcus equorum]|nr:hypothetical protein [Staphylococcus equorum]
MNASNVDSKKGVLKPLGLASSMTFVYILLFIALMLVSDKRIGMDGVVLPALVIFLVVSGVKYLFVKKDKGIPQWLVIGLFFLSSALAVVMAIVL